jgi:predicted metal-dependent hydrolase
VVAEPPKRWGSTTKAGIVRINWRVLQCPVSLVDYVLAHELVHLIHEDHSRAFWATLGRIMPDYEERKKRLREMGPRLVW